MKINLVEEWRTVAKKAWSFRLSALTVICTGVDVALPYFAPEHAGVKFGMVTLAVSALAAWARLVKQPQLRAAAAEERNEILYAKKDEPARNPLDGGYQPISSIGLDVKPPPKEL